jgi:hypothetical protein
LNRRLIFTGKPTLSVEIHKGLHSGRLLSANIGLWWN